MRWILVPPCSVQMEYLFHFSPPLSGLARRQRLLHRTHHRPPLPCFDMSCHPRHIALEVVTGILEVAEQPVVFPEDRVAFDVAGADHLHNFWPDRRVVLPIGFLASWLDSNRHSVSLHLSTSQ